MDDIASKGSCAIFNFWIGVKGNPRDPVNPTGKTGDGRSVPGHSNLAAHNVHGCPAILKHFTDLFLDIIGFPLGNKRAGDAYDYDEGDYHGNEQLYQRKCVLFFF